MPGIAIHSRRLQLVRATSILTILTLGVVAAVLSSARYSIAQAKSGPQTNPLAAKAQSPGETTHVNNGQQLYTKYGCYECHLSQGQGSRSTGGPRLGPPQLPLVAFTAYVRAPNREMPPYTAKTVTDEELSDIYAFLQTIPEPQNWKSIPLLNH